MSRSFKKKKQLPPDFLKYFRTISFGMLPLRTSPQAESTVHKERPHMSLVFNPSWDFFFSFLFFEFFLTRGQRVGYRCPQMVPAFSHSQQRPLPTAVQVFPAEISLNPQHHDDSVTRHFCYSRQNSQMPPKIPPAPTLMYTSCISPFLQCVLRGKGKDCEYDRISLS